MPRLPLALLALAAVIPSARAAVAPPTIGPAESKALLRIATKLSGLPAKRAVPVVSEDPLRFRQRRATAFARLYPGSAQSYDAELYRSLGMSPDVGLVQKALVRVVVQQAFYDPLTRKVYVSRGRASRAAVLQQLVGALQDQAFGLGRLRGFAHSRDARLAALATAGGHASLVAPVPTAGARGGARLDRFLRLESAFPATVGLRLAADLHNLGGNAAVFGALRRFPETTEQIFHIDKLLEREDAVNIVLPAEAAGLRLVADDTFGELDLRALLAVFGIPRLAQVGEGWGGGRSAFYRSGPNFAAVLALDWDSESDAQQWAQAAALYVTSAFGAAVAGQPAATPCAANACWSRGSHAIAFERVGRRTALVLGTELAGSAELARAILGEA
ncbi:MAG TPA: hypothetical protein VM049_12240 [Gaiellaceae bacterium]|nr:hypothetical protein [Gaiellaceae bacterium]